MITTEWIWRQYVNNTMLFKLFLYFPFQPYVIAYISRLSTVGWAFLNTASAGLCFNSEKRTRKVQKVISMWSRLYVTYTSHVTSCALWVSRLNNNPKYVMTLLFWKCKQETPTSFVLTWLPLRIKALLFSGLVSSERSSSSALCFYASKVRTRIFTQTRQLRYCQRRFCCIIIRWDCRYFGETCAFRICDVPGQGDLCVFFFSRTCWLFVFYTFAELLWVCLRRAGGWQKALKRRGINVAEWRRRTAGESGLF